MQSPPVPSQSLPEESDRLRSITTFSLLSGLTCLLPIPFVDDWAHHKIRARHLSKLAASHGFDILPGALERMLSSEPQGGCWRRGCVAAVWTPIRFVFGTLFRRLLRKILFVLAIRDTAVRFAATFEEAFLFSRWLTSRKKQERHGPPELAELRTFNQVLLTTVAEHDESGLIALVTASLKSARQSLRQLIARRKLPPEGSHELDSLVDDLTERLKGQSDYLTKLEEAFLWRWRSLEHGGAPQGTVPENPQDQGRSETRDLT